MADVVSCFNFLDSSAHPSHDLTPRRAEKYLTSQSAKLYHPDIKNQERESGITNIMHMGRLCNFLRYPQNLGVITYILRLPIL